MGNKEIKEVIEGLKVIAVTVKKITADGKVNLEDLPHVMSVVADSAKIVEAFKGLDVAAKEAQTLTEEEAKEIVALLYSAAKAVQEAA